MRCVSMNFWKLSALALAGFIIWGDVIPAVGHYLNKGKHDPPSEISVVKTVSAAQIYPEFTCPCCGQPLDKDEPCCGAMTNMIDFIDQQVASGKGEEEIYLATVKEFGLDRLTREEKREEIRAILAERAPADAPKIVVDPESKDLGEISQARGEVSTDFKLQNSGQSDLVINKLSSSCGCTSAAILYQDQEGPRFTMEGHGKDNPTDWQIAIAPGNTAILRVYYDPTVHKDLTGPVTRTVSVFSNDPVEFEKQVTITLNQAL